MILDSFALDITTEQKHKILNHICEYSSKHALRTALREAEVRNRTEAMKLWGYNMKEWILEEESDPVARISERDRARARLFDRMLEAKPIEHWIRWFAGLGNLWKIEQCLKAGGVTNFRVSIILNNNLTSNTSEEEHKGDYYETFN